MLARGSKDFGGVIFTLYTARANSRAACESWAFARAWDENMCVWSNSMNNAPMRVTSGKYTAVENAFLFIIFYSLLCPEPVPHVWWRF